MILTDKPLPQAARWHVLGAGAMGCLWAGAMHQHLRQTSQSSSVVTLLLRNRQALLAYPGHVTSSDMAQPMAMPARAIEDLTGHDLEPINNLLVATKAQDTLNAIESVAADLSPTSRIVLLQNGLKVQYEVSRRFGAERVFCLSTSHGAWLCAPYHVVHAGDGDAWLGQPSAAGAKTHAQLQSLLRLLPSQQFNIRPDGNIETRLWRKLAINCAVNALTVIHDCCNGDLLQIPEASDQLATLCDEISALMHAIPAAPAIDDLHSQVREVLTVTADNVSSTLQDIRRGRRTEIDHLNGYLCERAQYHHLPCPANKAVLQQVRMIESRARRATSDDTNQRPS